MEELTNRAEEIFCAAMPMGPEERRAYLGGACAEDAGLRARVEQMLSRSAKAEHFFQEGQLGVDLAQYAGELALGAQTDAFLDLDPEIGNQLVRYKLIEKLGEGGCGVVYLAEQEKPVRRPVAFKIIKLGMDTKSFIARFNAERQVLAMMDHTNVARVLDAGATEKAGPTL